MELSVVLLVAMDPFLRELGSSQLWDRSGGEELQGIVVSWAADLRWWLPCLVVMLLLLLHKLYTGTWIPRKAAECVKSDSFADRRCCSRKFHGVHVRGGRGARSCFVRRASEFLASIREASLQPLKLTVLRQLRGLLSVAHIIGK